MDRTSGSSPTPNGQNKHQAQHFPIVLQNNIMSNTTPASMSALQIPHSPGPSLPPKQVGGQSSNKPILKIKPPLAGKPKNQGRMHHGAASAEDVLKLAQEGLTNIDNELITKDGTEGKQKISSNFNLSFNNSFNTSYNHGKQEPQATMKFESNTKNQGYTGYITKDAVFLEKQLSDRLSNLRPDSNDSKKMIQVFGHTFDEVIKRDKDFGSLLLKIKKAYDVYLQKATNKETEARSQSLKSRLELAEEKDEVLEHNKKMEAMRSQMANMERKAGQQALEMNKMMQMLTSKEEENLTLRSLCDKQQKELQKFVKKEAYDKEVQTENEVNDQATAKRVYTIDSSAKSHMRGDQAANMSLSMSNQSATDMTNPANKPRCQSMKEQKSQNGSGSYENRAQILEDMGRLVKQNKEMNEACAEMGDEIQYLKLREKKIMYLVHLLQNKGYPVQNVYEKELKHISTMRIQEFLDEKEQEHYDQEYGGAEVDDKYDFSFHTDDSFEAIDDGPMLRPVKPDFVPMLDLEGLPGYETSSDEEEDEQFAPNQQQHYQSQELPSEKPPIHYEESMKYIQDFYDKYHNPSDQQSPQPADDISRASAPEGAVFQVRDGLQQDEAPDSIYEEIEQNQ